jgi:NAD(P)-dependent dehydrogenase (short-subunit alcohol dehydrogenase family)
MNRVNAIGPLLLTQALAGRLGEGSTVVAVSSWLGSIGGKSSGGNYGYCASKTLLNMYLRAMAFDLKPSGVTTILVNPGWVQTDMGGSRAKFTPEESVAGILALAARVTPDDAGAFFDHDGTPHAW